MAGRWLVLQAALLAFGSMAAALPFTALFYIAVCLVWVNSTLSLAKTMEGHEEHKQVRYGGVFKSLLCW